MSVLKTKRHISARAAVIIGLTGFVSLAALPAHALSAQEKPVEVTVSLPEIHNEADRAAAIDNFSEIAKKACRINGTRGLQAHRQSLACQADLIEAFTQRLDMSSGQTINSLAHKETETCVIGA